VCGSGQDVVGGFQAREAGAIRAVQAGHFMDDEAARRPGDDVDIQGGMVDRILRRTDIVMRVRGRQFALDPGQAQHIVGGCVEVGHAQATIDVGHRVGRVQTNARDGGEARADIDRIKRPVQHDVVSGRAHIDRRATGACRDVPGVGRTGPVGGDRVAIATKRDRAISQRCRIKRVHYGAAAGGIAIGIQHRGDDVVPPWRCKCRRR